MYLLILTFGLCFSYIILFFLFPYFFKGELPKISVRSLGSIAIIFVASITSFVVSEMIPDPELKNRVLHGLGGGFVAFLVCFLAARDSNVAITKFQFFILSVLVVTAMGVGNEIVEFFVQEYFPFIHFVFSAGPLDTWLDLVSNTVGILVAAVCFVPFINKNKQL